MLAWMSVFLIIGVVAGSFTGIANAAAAITTATFFISLILLSLEFFSLNRNTIKSVRHQKNFGK